MGTTLLFVNERKSIPGDRVDTLFVHYGSDGGIALYASPDGNMDDIPDMGHKAAFHGMRIEVKESSFDSLFRIYRELRLKEEEEEVIRAQLVRYRYPNKPSHIKFFVDVEVWSRDCDNVETTTSRQIEATPEAYERLYDQIENDAEGPFSLRILSPEERENFTSSWRDRALEAYEDGHPHSIY